MMFAMAMLAWCGLGWLFVHGMVKYYDHELETWPEWALLTGLAFGGPAVWALATYIAYKDK